MLTPSYHTKLITQLARVKLFGHKHAGCCLQCRRNRSRASWYSAVRLAGPTSSKVDAVSCALHGHAYLVCAECYTRHLVMSDDLETHLADQYSLTDSRTLYAYPELPY